MKGRKKFYTYFSLMAAAVYLALVVILYCSESSHAGSGIRTLGDAFWYSLVTLTTVGYGDLVPVTPLGHAVGIVFLLLATGIMVTLLGAVTSFILIFHREFWGRQRSLLERADRVILCEDEGLTDLSLAEVHRAYRKYRETKSVESLNEDYRRLDHMRWLRFYVFYNWRYGPVHDDGAREDPMIRPYEDLTPDQKRKRDAAWELLGRLPEELGGLGKL